MVTLGLWLLAPCPWSCRLNCFWPIAALQPVYTSSAQTTKQAILSWSDVKRLKEGNRWCRGVGRGYLKRSCQMLQTACLLVSTQYTHPSPTISSALHHSYGKLHPLLLYHLTPNAFTNLAPKNNSMLLVNSVVMACKLPLLLTNWVYIHILDGKPGQKLEGGTELRHQ